MSQQSIKTDALLKAITDHLNLQFFVDSRNNAKNRYKVIEQGQRLPFMKMELGDESEVICELELDISEYVGKLNFGKFRKCLAVMMLSVHQRLEAKSSLNPMSSDNGEVLFNVPGVLKSDDEVNIIVSGFRQLAPGRALVRLMYLNPQAYADSAGVDLAKLESNDNDPALQRHA